MNKMKRTIILLLLLLIMAVPKTSYSQDKELKRLSPYLIISEELGFICTTLLSVENDIREIWEKKKDGEKLGTP